MKLNLKVKKTQLNVVCVFTSISQDKDIGWEKERPWPYLLGHISVERLFISLSHLQHSDTVAVKDSFPKPQADTGSGRNDIESKV